MHTFPSNAWAAAFRDRIEASQAYRRSAAGWTAGPVALVIEAAPTLGMPEAEALWLDLERGRCLGARVVSRSEAERAPFAITGDYATWRAILSRDQHPVRAIVSRRLALRGSLFTLMRYTTAAEELVACATQVPTRFIDGTTA